MMSTLSDENVVSSKTLYEQIGWLCTLLRPNGMGVSYENIGLLFNPSKSHATIKRHFEAFQKIPKEPKRPEILTEEQYQELASKLSSTIKESGNPSLYNVQTFIRDSFQIEVSRTTASRILKRIGFKLIKAKPMEEERYNCSLEEILQYYKTLAELLTEIPCGFCFNLDESGIQRYVDARDTYLVVPENFPDEELTFPVYRSAKRITLLHCIKRISI